MLSRRDVVTTAAGAAVAMASQGGAPAKAQRRRRIIVDAQVHIWLANTPERPWPADGIGQAHIPRPFSYYELSARMEEAGVDRVVIVPPSWEGYHNEYAICSRPGRISPACWASATRSTACRVVG